MRFFRQRTLNLFLVALLVALTGAAVASDNADKTGSTNDQKAQNKQVHEKLQEQFATVSASVVKSAYLGSNDKCRIGKKEFHDYARVIEKLGGAVLNPYEFSHDLAGLDNFLKASGIRYFSAEEIVTPHKPGIAKKVGYELFLPPRCRWLGGAAIIMIADRIRAKINHPIHFRNWWRPRPYNNKVASAKASDHIQARAIDIDFVGSLGHKHKRTALKWLCSEFWKEGYDIQLGMYASTALHIGLESPKFGGQKRYWGQRHPCKPHPVPGAKKSKSKAEMIKEAIEEAERRGKDK